MAGGTGCEVTRARRHRSAEAPTSEIVVWAAAAIVGALGYGALLLKFTDAYAPFIDSLVLTFSILAQFLLMRRRVETWWCWLIVNTIAVPLYLSRDLVLTAAFYAAYWVNACVAMRRWCVLLDPSGAPRSRRFPARSELSV